MSNNDVCHDTNLKLVENVSFLKIDKLLDNAVNARINIVFFHIYPSFSDFIHQTMYNEKETVPCGMGQDFC